MIQAPASEAELAEVVRGLAAPVRIVGGGTRAGLGNPVAAAATLSVARLAGITLYEPGALTLVARAGTRVAEVEAALAAEGQMLAFEPADHRALYGTAGEPTLGGVVATNASGPRRVLAGAARDHLIGVRFVDGSGRVVKNGGRVMKNVTGYDLVKLMAGSHGTLGILTEVAFKVLPRPQAQAILAIEGIGVDAAVAAMTAALGSPFEVSGAAHDVRAGRTAFRIEGFPEQVAYRAERLAALIGAAVPGARVDRDGPDPFPALRRFGWAAAAAGDLWRIAVRPTDAPVLVRALREAGVQPVLLDWGGGLVWAEAPEGTDLRARNPVPGHAMLVRGGEATRARLGAFQPQADAVAALARGLRARFDPRGLLNPGRMG